MSRVILLFILYFAMNSTCVAHAEDEWKERKGNHFILYYKNAPPDFVKSVEEMAEYYYEEITRNMGFTRDQIGRTHV